MNAGNVIKRQDRLLNPQSYQMHYGQNRAKLNIFTRIPKNSDVIIFHTINLQIQKAIYPVSFV